MTSGFIFLTSRYFINSNGGYTLRHCVRDKDVQIVSHLKGLISGYFLLDSQGCGSVFKNTGASFASNTFPHLAGVVCS